MAAPRSNLLRAGSLGLLLAFTVGGLALVGVGAWRSLLPPGCEGLGPNECALERSTTHELARDQLFAGAALLLLAAALVPAVRRP